MKFGIASCCLLILLSFRAVAQSPAADTVRVRASEQYEEPSLLNIIFIGTNYRREWATPVCLPVFRLKGLTITELGGGMQTKSLYVKDRHNEEWVLRTVDKDPREALPSFIRNRITVQVLQQIISAAHPYAPLTIPTMAKAANVSVTNPVFYWVPDDPAFGKYRSLFANTVCLFEKKNIVSKPVMETPDLVKKMLSDDSYQLDQQAYLRARLLDMLIGDWDRHPDQWLWVQQKNGIEALPKDRDQAFFRSHGLLAKIASLIKLKHLVGFTRNARNIRRLNAKSWHMDGLFTNELTRDDWERTVNTFCTNVSDTIIAEALYKIPPEIYAISGSKIKSKLINRRNQMRKSGPRYYRFLSKRVIIHGTSQRELFDVKGRGDSVTITGSSNKTIFYKRTFYKKETKCIRLYGLGGDDVFTTSGSTGIKVQIDKDMDALSYEKHLRTYLRIKD